MKSKLIILMGLNIGFIILVGVLGGFRLFSHIKLINGINKIDKIGETSTKGLIVSHSLELLSYIWFYLYVLANTQNVDFLKYLFIFFRGARQAEE